MLGRSLLPPLALLPLVLGSWSRPGLAEPAASPQAAPDLAGAPAPAGEPAQRTAATPKAASEPGSKAAPGRTSARAKKPARLPAEVSTAAECRPHAAQEFLKRRAFVRNNMVDGAKNARAVRWRAETYGSVEGVEGVSAGGASAISHARAVRFMGLPIQVHEKIAGPLACVERRIRKTCTGSKAYTPRALGGFRVSNTYRQGEVSNHLFGIAVDIDPARNPCCGCVEPWPTHPACKDPGRSAFEQSELPRCWIDAFERYGFYWLGRDPLRDTMHFEYLGDPDRGKPKPKPEAVARGDNDARRRTPKATREDRDKQAKSTPRKPMSMKKKPATDALSCGEPYPDPACSTPVEAPPAGRDSPAAAQRSE